MKGLKQLQCLPEISHALVHHLRALALCLLPDVSMLPPCLTRHVAQCSTETINLAPLVSAQLTPPLLSRLDLCPVILMLIMASVVMRGHMTRMTLGTGRKVPITMATMTTNPTLPSVVGSITMDLTHTRSGPLDGQSTGIAVRVKKLLMAPWIDVTRRWKREEGAVKKKDGSSRMVRTLPLLLEWSRTNRAKR